MDELDISGKRYISSKRAARENRYHVDYIGQLIRAGKIIGSKVGRTWYVEEESLAKYLDQDYKEPTTPAPQPEIYVPTQKIEVAQAQAPSYSYAEEPAQEVETPKGENKSSTEPAQHITITKIEEEDLPEQPRKAPVATNAGAGLRYIDDDEPLLPVLGRRERPIVVHTATETQEMSRPLATKPAPRALPAPTASPVQPKTLLLVGGIVGLIAFCGTLGLSYFLKADTTVEVANTYSSIHF